MSANSWIPAIPTDPYWIFYPGRIDAVRIAPDNNYELYDNVIWHHATHTVKFGGIGFTWIRPVNANNARGTFPVSSTAVEFLTGNALGDFLTGYDLAKVQVDWAGAARCWAAPTGST